MIPRRRYNVESGFVRDAVRGGLAPSHMHAFVQRFETALALRLGGQLTVQAAASGRAALAILLDTLGVPRGSTVMIPAYTLGAIGPFLNSIGYRWITCDVDAKSPVMTPETVMAALSCEESVKCVLATHLFGIPADVPAIADAVKPLGAIVIEDCAHSAGSTFDGRNTGTLARGSIFSFNYLKPVNCFGGGAVVLPGHRELMQIEPQSHRDTAAMFAAGLVEDAVFAGPWLRIPTAMLAFERLRPMMTAIDNTIRRPEDEKFDIRGMSPLQALHGMHSLESLDRRLARRRSIARTLCEAAGIDDTIYREDSPTRSNAYFVTVRVRDPDRFRRDLWMNGIDAGIRGEVADCIESPLCGPHPGAREWFNSAVQLPCHEALSGRQVSVVAQLVNRLMDRSQRIQA